MDVPMVLGYPLEEVFQYSVITNIVTIVLLLAIYLMAGKVTILWMWANLTKQPISIEWCKNKSLKFEIPFIPKGFSDMWILGRPRTIVGSATNHGGHAVEVRREAVGAGPHNVPMMISTAEFSAAVSPAELNGERYYQPTEVFRGQIEEGTLKVYTPPTLPEDANADEVQFYNHKLEKYNNLQMWVTYPQRGLDASEFVAFQNVNPDPTVIQNYADYADLEARKEVYSTMNTAMQWIPLLIPLLIIGGIVYVWISQNNQAASMMGALNSCRETVWSLAQSCPQAAGDVLKLNATALAKTGTGGGIVP